MRNLQYHIRPGYVQTKQHAQQTVEYVVGRKHGQNAWCLNRTAVDDARKEAQPCHDPQHRKYGKNAIAQFLVIGVFGDFRRLSLQ